MQNQYTEYSECVVIEVWCYVHKRTLDCWIDRKDMAILHPPGNPTPAPLSTLDGTQKALGLNPSPAPLASGTQMTQAGFYSGMDIRKALWTANPARAPKGKWYVQARVWDKEAQRTRTVMLHRVLMGVTDSEVEVDHRDNDGLNNRRNNLRLCTHQQNLRFRNPKKDWKRLDELRNLAEEYRKERKIAEVIRERFGITRQSMWRIKLDPGCNSRIAVAYREAIAEAGIRDYFSLKQLMPNQGERGKRSGVFKSAGKMA